MNNDLAKLIQLEYNCKNCENDTELYYILVNQTRSLVDYDQAVLLTTSLNSKLTPVAISDMTAVDSTSPYVQFVNEFTNYYINLNKENIGEVHNININELDESLKKQIKNYSPSNILWVPLKTIKNNIEIEFYLLLFKNSSFNEKEIEIIKHISESYKYFLFSVRKCGLKTFLENFKFKSKYFKYGLLALILVMFIPVRMSVLAPFEVKAKDPFVVTSPIEGAVDEIKISPNEFVKKDQLVVKIKDTDLSNNYEVALRKLETIKAQLHTVKQVSFYDSDRKTEINKLESEVKLKVAELEYAKSQLEKTNIYAKSEGIAIIKNPNDWIGKPVVTGERIFLVAKQKQIELKIMLAVSDALFLQENADVKIFIDNKVFESWDAKISNISYEPELTPENILSYKIIADFNDLNQNDEAPTIGLRGTAKIYSDEVSLFFYLFRKPITGLRQFIGW